jgi:hypothetical protein
MGAFTTTSKAAAPPAQIKKPQQARIIRSVSALRAGGAPPIPAVGS